MQFTVKITHFNRKNVHFIDFNNFRNENVQ